MERMEESPIPPAASATQPEEDIAQSLPLPQVGLGEHIW
jgi:hypothetical protein